MIKRFRTMVLVFSLFTLFKALSGCSAYNNVRSAYAYPSVDSKLVLMRTLVVLPGKAGLYIQNGLNRGGKHSRFEPFCYIRFRNVAASRRNIVPDTFIVKSSRVEMRLIADQGFIRSNKPSFRLVDSTPSDILEVVTMRLYSAKNPKVYLIECGGVENSPAEVEPPTIADIRNALGNIMALKLL